MTPARIAELRKLCEAARTSAVVGMLGMMEGLCRRWAAADSLVDWKMVEGALSEAAAARTALPEALDDNDRLTVALAEQAGARSLDLIALERLRAQHKVFRETFERNAQAHVAEVDQLREQRDAATARAEAAEAEVARLTEERDQARARRDNALDRLMEEHRRRGPSVALMETLDPYTRTHRYVTLMAEDAQRLRAAAALGISLREDVSRLAIDNANLRAELARRSP